MPSKRRRKLDQYLRGVREDPDVVLQEMAHLSNRLFRLSVGLVLTLAMVLLVVWPLDGRMGWPAVVGTTVLLLLANSLGWLAVLRVHPRLFERPANFNQLIFLLGLTVALSWCVFKLGWSPFLAPLSMLAMVLAITFGQPVAFLLVAGLGFYLGLLSPRAFPLGGKPGIDIVLALSLSMGGLVSVLGMARVRQQSRPFMVGLYAGLAQAGMVIAFQLLGIEAGVGITLDDFRSQEGFERVARFLQNPLWAVSGGLLSGATVTCFLPALERFFGIVTERRLLALHDPNNELLQALRNYAPGTHTHTLRVADLASAAAEAIGADPLLSRVGAYYHDIGKIAKPEYFVENRESGQSVHDRLRPSMSKLVIISHVKEGIELAEEARLPQKIIDMIPMHHGTTVVEYFYHKAKTEGDASEPEVEYRYPGPKPRFREAGILMLADSVEATAKAIPEPNPSRFRDMVHQMVLKRLLDHQLDECDLTMRDLTRIEDSFVRTLTYMYHGRIKYPEKDAGPGGGGDSTPPARRRSPPDSTPGAGEDSTPRGRGRQPPDSTPGAPGAPGEPKEQARQRQLQAAEASSYPTGPQVTRPPRESPAQLRPSGA